MKTQKIINTYQNNNTQLFDIYIKNNQKIINKNIGKTLDADKFVKIQILPNTSEIFQLILNNSLKSNQISVKLVFKKIIGGKISYGISPRPIKLTLQNCSNQIQDDRIIVIKNINAIDEIIYLTIYSYNDLASYKFKYTFDSHSFQTSPSLPKISLNTIVLDRSKSIKAIINAPTNINQDKMDNLLNLKRQKSPKIKIRKQDILSARLKSIQNQKQKALKIVYQKHNIELYRQKSKSLKQVSYSCKGLVRQISKQYQQQKQANKNNLKLLSISIYTILFISNIQNKIKNRILDLQKVYLKGKIVNKFINKLKKQHKQIVSIQPSPYRRESTTILSIIVLQSKIILKKQYENAYSIIREALKQRIIPSLVNKAFNKATIYRIKIKNIQSFWKTRFQAQMQVLTYYVQKQSHQIIKKYTKFQVLKQLFYSLSMPSKLSYQYIKESTLKINSIYQNYQYRLKQIQQIHQANHQISIHNSKSLKKHQKQLLHIPPTPSYPVLRYFRDVDILKSMTRTWFQIQHRKYLKKNKSFIPLGKNNTKK